jgi:hypothetical protein
VNVEVLPLPFVDEVEIEELASEKAGLKDMS